MKLATVVGARPQFVKAATVSRLLSKQAAIEEVFIHTGQHYDENMSDVFFKELDLPTPDYFLGVGSGKHGAQTGHMLAALENVFIDEKPDWILVYGDTNSTLAAALAAAKLHIPIAHIEAGLRSFNRTMPEEINRVLTDHLSELLFVPSETATKNLRAEGISAEKIHLSGDVMYDAALFYAARAESQSTILDKLGLMPKQYILATIHRAENTDDVGRLRAIFAGLAQVSAITPVVLPLHPRTRAALARENLLDEVTEKLRLIDPVGYLDMIMLEKQTILIVTDSGGVQKEAFFYRVPCITLRDQTEWSELVDMGWNILCPPIAPETIAQEIFSQQRKTGMAANGLYGDGKAVENIIEVLNRQR